MPDLNPLTLLLQKTGKYAEYTAFKLLVHVLVDAGGKVWSVHDFQTPEDSVLSGKLPGGGVRHIAHVFLVEAFRREVFAGIMAKITHDPTFLQGYQQGDPENRFRIEQDLAQGSRQVLVNTTGKIGVEVAREILAMFGEPA